MKKITLLFLFISLCGYGQTTLLDFESATAWTDFDGGVVTTEANPHKNADNNSDNVGKMVKNAGQTWGGSWTQLTSAIDFVNNNTLSMKVYSPRAGVKVLLKVENAADSNINFQKEVTMTKANAWETLTFDYSAINTANSYEKIVLIFDNGTMGDGSANFTFYIDDVVLSNTTGGATVNLPIGFETATTWVDFDGGVVTTENNPHSNADNNSAKVGKMVKSAGQTWGGSSLVLSSAMDFNNNNTFKMKVYSSRANAKVLLKVENSGDANINFQKEVTMSKANAWETLTFDYSGIDATKSYNKLVLIFDNGTMGDGTANFTFYIDDITLFKSGSGSTVNLPINFETATTWVDFDGGVVTTATNPHNNADNNSAKVGKMVKNAGQTWGGSSLVLSSAMDFNNNNTFKMKVYSPRANAKILLKVENSGDANINYQKEVTMSKANAWETLTFDYSGIDATKSYNKLVLIFDNGTMGDGTTNFTFYFDDIELSKGNTTTSEPTAAAKVPTVPSNGVSSVYSDAYTDLANVEFNPNWGQTTTMSDFMIGNDNMKKYSNMNFTGINLNTQVDATAKSITHFHVDVWSADFTEFKIKIVDFGPNGVWEQNGDNVEHELTFASPTKSGWVSYDIPLSDFTGLTTKDHIAQIVFSSSAGATVFIDNIYFYNAAVLSTDEISQLEIKAYPNPVHNNLTILAKSAIQEVEIFNILGKKVLAQRIDNTRATIDVTGLNSGMYIVKYTINNLIGTRKFVKQ